ncbi:MAG TPA: hypothetical protein VGL69_10020 [Solirubrobacteraceae bacterium]
MGKIQLGVEPAGSANVASSFEPLVLAGVLLEPPLVLPLSLIPPLEPPPHAAMTSVRHSAPATPSTALRDLR